MKNNGVIGTIGIFGVSGRPTLSVKEIVVEPEPVIETVTEVKEPHVKELLPDPETAFKHGVITTAINDPGGRFVILRVGHATLEEVDDYIETLIDGPFKYVEYNISDPKGNVKFGSFHIDNSHFVDLEFYETSGVVNIYCGKGRLEEL